MPRRKFNHKENRCEDMKEWDSEFTLTGSARSCCICEKHHCAVYLKYLRAKRAKRSINQGK